MDRLSKYMAPPANEIELRWRMFQWRMLFGYSTLFFVGCITLAIGLGSVKMENSYGLLPCITILSGMGGGFITWAYGQHAKGEGKNGAQTSDTRIEENKPPG